MILYFAGESPVDNKVLKESGVKNLLKSYFYLKGNPEYTKDLMANFNVFIDSGAFSAMTRKTTINLDKYIEFVKHYKPVVYAGLDVIGDAEATKKNIAYMEEHELHPIPTFHRGSKLKYLLEMLDNYDYIALGGIAIMGLSSKQRHMFLDRCWHQIQKRNPDIKVHGFGCSGEAIMRQYPWHSVDSTSWLAPVVYGRELDGLTGREIIWEAGKTQDHEIYWHKGKQREVILKKSIQMFLDLERNITDTHKSHKFENLKQADLFDL
jgi:hypothetical protein